MNNRIKQAERVIKYYKYFEVQLKKAMEDMMHVFSQVRATVYGFKPYIWRNPKNGYVGLYFEYLVAADSICSKTWQIPEITNSGMSHITLFESRDFIQDGVDKHIDYLDRKLKEKQNDKMYFMPIARWQNDDREQWMTQLYFQGNELAQNLETFVTISKKSLRKIITFDGEYHISL